MRIAFDVGGTSIRAAAGASADSLMPLGHLSTPGTSFDDFVAALRELIPRDTPPDTEVALAITGTAHPETGEMTIVNIPVLQGRPLARDLAEALGRPVRVANDADCFTLAEAVLGAGGGHRVVFGAVLGTGVGGGLVIDGHIHSGGRGIAGEWGHSPVAATELPELNIRLPRFACGCGHEGCLNTVGGGPGLSRLHDHLHAEKAEPQAIVARWRQGEPKAGLTIAAHRALLAPHLALIANLVGADIIPVGGGLGRARDLVGELDLAVRALMLHPPKRPFVVPAEVNVLTPGLVGAALLCDQ